MKAFELDAHLRASEFHFNDELDLQNGIAKLLDSLGVGYLREAQIGSGRESRVDFLIFRVALEVKVGGSTADVIRQLSRYAGADSVDELILVTSRLRHRMQLPGSINGKPLFVMEIVRL